MDTYKPTKQDRENALERFKNELINDERTIYGQIVHVSPSGMTRWLRFFVAEIDHNGLPVVRDWTFTIGLARKSHND